MKFSTVLQPFIYLLHLFFYVFDLRNDVFFGKVGITTVCDVVLMFQSCGKRAVTAFKHEHLGTTHQKTLLSFFPLFWLMLLKGLADCLVSFNKNAAAVGHH